MSNLLNRCSALGHQRMTHNHCAQVKRLHKLNNPNTPLPMSGNELADVIKNAATGALEVLQAELQHAKLL